MRLYTIHEAPAGRPEDAVFVKDGFCWPALFIPGLWLIYRRLWLGLALWLIVGMALAAAVEASGLGGGATMVVMAGFYVLVAFEANNWLRWTLGRHGHHEVASIVAPNLTTAEQRYFEWRFARSASVSSPPVSQNPAPPPMPDYAPPPFVPPVPRGLTDSPAMGLFPRPERRA